MPRTLTLALALLLSTGWLMAQSQSSQTGSASDQSTTSSSGQTQVQGCLQGSNGNYTLTADSGTTYQLQGDTSKLDKHVGHEVQITGSTSGAGAAGSSSAAGSNAGASNTASQQTLNVSSVKHIATSCTNPSK